MQTEKEQVQGQAPNLIIRGGGGPSLLRPWPRDFWPMGLSGPTFFLLSH